MRKEMAPGDESQKLLKQDKKNKKIIKVKQKWLDFEFEFNLVWVQRQLTTNVSSGEL